jgi:hypothetical protein
VLFEEFANFNHAHFDNNAWFTTTAFEDSVVFASARFDGSLWFDDARFPLGGIFDNVRVRKGRALLMPDDIAGSFEEREGDPDWLWFRQASERPPRQAAEA